MNYQAKFTLCLISIALKMFDYKEVYTVKSAYNKPGQTIRTFSVYQRFFVNGLRFFITDNALNAFNYIWSLMSTLKVLKLQNSFAQFDKL